MSKITETLSVFLLLTLIFITTESRQILPQPQEHPSFKPQNTTTTTNSQLTYTCSYKVTIKTSCSSPSYTRDKISLSFGDAYQNEVYAPWIDDPSERTFERCSTDTFTITGPCMYRICYLYLYRTGSDGWKVDSVKVYEPKYGTATFTYKAYIPYGVWYGFNFCQNYLGLSADI